MEKGQFGRLIWKVSDYRKRIIYVVSLGDSRYDIVSRGGVVREKNVLIPDEQIVRKFGDIGKNKAGILDRKHREGYKWAVELVS